MRKVRKTKERTWEIGRLKATTILSRSLGFTVLAASKSNEEALEGYKDHGLFTYVVADGLQSREDADQNGIVSAFRLADYVHDQVPKLALNVS
jgi:uncharacterized caspase-like protein